MKIGKPITKNMELKCEMLFQYMRSRGYVTKEEVMIALDLTNERSARDVISILAKKYPVVATSDNKGYKLAGKLENFEEVCHTWREIDHRQAELEERKQPLIKYFNILHKKGLLDNDKIKYLQQEFPDLYEKHYDAIIKN